MSEYLSVEAALSAAPSDIQEKDVEVWGGKVKVRGLTAAQSTRIRQIGVSVKNTGADLAWAEMEKMQFKLGVVQPSFSTEDVEKLHRVSGAGFAAIIDAIDELTGIRKEDLRKAQEDFQESETPAEDGVGVSAVPGDDQEPAAGDDVS
jgi:Iap family predicted aminopeptidase